MKATKFNEDYEFYKNNLSKKLDEQTVGIMLHAYCMGCIQAASQMAETYDIVVDVDCVLDKISELNHHVHIAFNGKDNVLVNVDSVGGSI